MRARFVPILAALLLAVPLLAPSIGATYTRAERFEWTCRAGACDYRDGALALCADGAEARLVRLTPSIEGGVSIEWNLDETSGARSLTFSFRTGEAAEHRVVLDAARGLVLFDGGLVGAPAPLALVAGWQRVNVDHRNGVATVSVGGLPAAVAAYAPSERATRFGLVATGAGCHLVDNFHPTYAPADKFSWQCLGVCHLDDGIHLCADHGVTRALRTGESTDGAYSFSWDPRAAPGAQKSLAVDLRAGMAETRRVTFDLAAGEVRFSDGLVGPVAPLALAPGAHAVELAHEDGRVVVRIDGAHVATGTYGSGAATLMRFHVADDGSCMTFRDVLIPYPEGPG